MISTKKKAFRYSRSSIWLVVLTALTPLLAVTCIAQDAVLQTKGAYLNDLKTHLSVVEQVNRDEKLEIEALTRPVLLEEIAVTQLGMVRATEQDIVYYDAVIVQGETSDEKEKDGGFFSAFQRLIAER